MFHVGQLVVCVDGRWDRCSGYKEFSPTKGVVYTVREIVEHGENIGLQLEEIINPPYLYIEGFCEVAFAAARFRPVVETRLDVFREMLAPVPGVKQKECVP